METMVRSREVIAELGITTRQFDYLRRVGVLPPAHGSGSRYELSAGDVGRLRVAARLNLAAGSNAWPRMAEACLAGPPPPERGWACVCPDGRVLYGDTLSDVADGLASGGIVAAFARRD